MTSRILSALIGATLLVALLGCASGGAPNPPDQPQRLSVTFDMGQSAGASSRGFSPEKTVGDYTVQLESAAGGFDPVTKALTGHVRVHNKSAGSTATMHDTQARIASITAIDGATDAFTFEVQVSWFAEDPAGEPDYTAGTGQHDDFSSNDGDWNYGTIASAGKSGFIAWTFTLEAWVAPPPTGFTEDALFSQEAGTAWSQPGGIALADNGHVFVSNTRNHEVIELGSSGGWIATYADGDVGTYTDHNSLKNPYGLWVAPADMPGYGGDIFIANTGVDRVVRWVPSLGQWTGELWTVSGVQSQIPLDVTGAPYGAVFAVDTGNGRVLWANADLSGSHAFGTKSSTPGDGQFSEPAGITLGPDGRLYVSDRTAQRIVRLNVIRDATEGYVTGLTWHDAWSSTELTTPRGICVDYAGYVYVADLGASKVVVFDSAGAFVRSLSLSYTPYDVDVSPDGQYLYVTGGASGSGSVQRYTITR